MSAQDISLPRLVEEVKHMALTFPLTEDEQAWLNEAARILGNLEAHRRIGEPVEVAVILERR
jgi:hypothetical protein